MSEEQCRRSPQMKTESGTKRKPEDSIHDFEIDDEWHGCFIVVGTTGSGKTTLIRFMTERTISGLSAGGEFKTSLDSVTEQSQVYKSGKIKYNDTSVTLKFRDTIGFGAKDMESKTILKDTFLDVVGDSDKVRGCILVHKCERYREGTAQDLKQVKQMLSTVGLDIRKHLLLVITNTAHLSEETQRKYSVDIRARVLPDLPAERIIHINFANLNELNEYHKQYFMDTRKTEFNRLIAKLKEFQDEISPASLETREYFKNAYDDQLQKKKPKNFFGLF